MSSSILANQGKALVKSNYDSVKNPVFSLRMQSTRAQLRADPFGLELSDTTMPAGIDLASLFTSTSVAVLKLRTSDQMDCTFCGGELRADFDGLRRVCAVCSNIIEGDSTELEEDDVPRSMIGASRLKLVGVGSSSLQPDLYRSGSSDNSVTQKRQITDEFMRFREQYIERGGQAIPINSISLAVELYHEVQRKCVKRSLNKKRIMAAVLRDACIHVGFLPSNAEIAHFMQLPNNGIAPGINFIRSLAADNTATESQADPWKPARAEITTLFAYLDLDGDEFTPMREAVFDIIKTAADVKIGTSSFLRSKVAGASYAVLRRTALSDGAGLSPAAQLAAKAAATKHKNLQVFCGDRIRKNTVERFLRELEDYHSNFEETYIRNNLDARRSIDLK